MLVNNSVTDAHLEWQHYLNGNESRPRISDRFKRGLADLLRQLRDVNQGLGFA
jgi:hypothetical protein